VEVKLSLIKLTEQYLKNFNNKDVDGVVKMFHDNAYISDPGNIHRGIDNIRKEIKNLLSNKTIFLEKTNIFLGSIDDSKPGISTILEFKITIGNTLDDLKTLYGVDVIIWKDDKIKEMRAYVY
jgi:hypothetical protein